MTQQVDIRGLRKRFGKRVALDGIDLSLDGGQIVGLVGPDGAGKTTLIRSLAGLLEVEAEKACVLGFDLRDDVIELKARVGYVPQSFGLQRDLSVIENLRFTARLHRLPGSESEPRIDELLERIGLAPFADRLAGALSGGMKQKLATANALLSAPRLLLLDEPTAGVDAPARAEIWSMLRSTRDQALVIISTSYLEEAESCDRLVYLDAGRVVAHDTPAALRQRVPIELYRAWNGAPRELARAAGRLPYVVGARRVGAFTRVEVSSDRSPGLDRIRNDLQSLTGESLHLVERVAVDMETTLLYYARQGLGA